MNFLPPNGALHGVALDQLLAWNLAIIVGLCIAAHILIAAAFLLRRARKSESPAKSQPRASLRPLLIIETLALLALTALYIAMDITGHHLWAATREQPSTPQPLQVEVTGVQFQWYFRYPGPDGLYGATRPDLISAPAGNPLGLDPADPHSTDDIVSAIFLLPANRPVEITLRSQDVIHGLFIPGMRLKQDAIPGMLGHLLFTPTTPGDYPILCSQVCGLGHYRMQARLRVVTQPEFDSWLATRESAASEASR